MDLLLVYMNLRTKRACHMLWARFSLDSSKGQQVHDSKLEFSSFISDFTTLNNLVEFGINTLTENDNLCKIGNMERVVALPMNRRIGNFPHLHVSQISQYCTIWNLGQIQKIMTCADTGYSKCRIAIDTMESGAIW